MSADITMCSGEKCKFKKTCYRYCAKPSLIQSYFSSTPFNKRTKKCEFYIKTQKEKKHGTK